MLAAQGLLVRRNAQLLPEPQGPRSGQSGQGPALRLLITGDSSAAGVGVDHQRQALSGNLVALLSDRFSISWQVEATTGHTTRDTIERLGQLNAEFDVVITALGVNDTTRATSRAAFVTRQTALLDHITGPMRAKLVLLTAVPQMNLFPALPQPLAWVLGEQSKRLDHGLAEVAGRFVQARHIRPDIPEDPRFAAIDGYHPSADAYRRWAATLAKTIFAQADLLT